MPSNNLYQDTNHKIRNNFNTIIDNRNLNTLKNLKNTAVISKETPDRCKTLIETSWIDCDVLPYYTAYYYNANYSNILNLPDFLCPHIRIITVVNIKGFINQMRTQRFFQQNIDSNNDNSTKTIYINTVSSQQNSLVDLKVKFIVRVPLIM